ncbi:DsbA family oxidoreductase [Gorillibacterium timonense]|uniref:DsbA family oxidoreductase n=1 Tax=Gorillibacterium timonense TaxID=1689269 RepID=UPI00071D7D54|nr:DsbA family oxidoreductase [Gorillibacterium timonense]
MKIEIWSDFACPFCYIGKQRLEETLDQFEHKGEVEVIFKSFELDPHAPRKIDHDVHDMLAEKYGMSRQEAIAMNENLAKQAEAAGLTFQFDTMKLTNTFDAHRLAQFAAKKGKASPMVQALFRAYFTDSRHLGDHETLADLAVEAGLDRDEALALLASADHSADVRADEDEAQKLGVRGVPFFVFDRKYAVSGAQPGEMFRQALETAWKESQPFTILSSPKGEEDDGCQDGSCSIH